MPLHDRDYMKSNQHGRWLDVMRPDAVTIIIVVNVVVFILQRWFGVLVDRIPLRGGDFDVDPWGKLSIQALLEGRVWTIVTHLFVHASVIHILGNCLMIFFSGKAVQTLLGSRHFLYIYFLSGLVGAALELLVGWVARDMHPMVGASAAAFGVFMALAVMLPHEMVTALLYFVIPVRMRLWNMALLFVGISLVLALLQVSKIWVTPIAHFAHLGGAFAGWWFVRLLGYGGPAVTYQHMWHERQRREEMRAYAGVRRQRQAAEADAITVDFKPRTTKEFIEREIDPILDKIAAHGMSSLTGEERELLARASEEILKRDA